MTKNKNSGSSPRKVENRHSTPPNATNVGFKPTHDWTILLYQFLTDYSIEKFTLRLYIDNIYVNFPARKGIEGSRIPLLNVSRV